MAEKANKSASTTLEAIWIPESARFLGGGRFDPRTGGIVSGIPGRTNSNNGYYSVADPARIFEGHVNLQAPEDTPHLVLARRVGAILVTQTANSALDSANAMSGGEFEGHVITAAGDYPSVMDNSGNYRGAFGTVGATAELYQSMFEVGFKPSANPEETLERWQTRFMELGNAATKDNVLVLPLAVKGSRVMTWADVNPHPYIADVVTRMTGGTGFDTVEAFNTAGSQFHTEIIETEAALKAARDYQFIAPHLYAASLSGPFTHGSLENSSGLRHPAELTDLQKDHMQNAGVTPSDLQGPYLSWRYLFRRIGSPSGGTWQREVPLAPMEHLHDAHQRLANGDIAVVDRNAGEHTDVRVRWGINTLEVCNFDTFAGDPVKNAAFQEFTKGIMLSLQRMHLYGTDPRQVLPKLFANQSLAQANRDNLAIARHGVDAVVGGRPVHAHVNDLIKLATHFNPEGLPEWVEREVRLSFATTRETEKNIKRWCAQNGALPSMRAYYETGVGVPAVYLRARAQELKRLDPKLPDAEIIRLCEIDAAEAWMQNTEAATIGAK